LFILFLSPIHIYYQSIYHLYVSYPSIPYHIAVLEAEAGECLTAVVNET
jgi:hypothetical protein